MGLPDYYSKAALDKLARFFQVPDAKQREATALLGCRINRDGTLTNIKVMRSCGSSELDELAILALQRTSRFIPFPDDFQKPFVDVEISFHFKR
jgi:TonB family protein